MLLRRLERPTYLSGIICRVWHLICNQLHGPAYEATGVDPKRKSAEYLGSSARGTSPRLAARFFMS